MTTTTRSRLSSSGRPQSSGSLGSSPFKHNVRSSATAGVRDRDGGAGAGADGTGKDKTDMWSSLLDSVASGKRLPEKTLIVLGGTPDTQRDFVDSLSSNSDSSSRPSHLQDRHARKPPLANSFALGYTYHDVLDADQEDILARLSIYTLADSSPAYAPLVRPLLTAQSIPESLLVILLDWSEPWTWVRQIRDWIWFLQHVLSDLGDQEKEVMQDVMQQWTQRKRGGTYEGQSGVAQEGVVIPLGSGEWDEPLGIPVCVVCQNVDQMDALEKERGWKEEDFDYVLQFLRTILLKHGASLIYTSLSMPNSLPTLVQSSLDIQSLLRKQPLRHNVIDREKILIPPNWDSWGKIRVLREGFDPSLIAEGWSTDIQVPSLPSPKSSTAASGASTPSPTPSGPRTTLQTYESTVQNPHPSSSKRSSSQKPALDLETPTMQTFLTAQHESLEIIKAEEATRLASTSPSATGTAAASNIEESSNAASRSAVNEHIGPVQFNMGGIQVDAEDVLQRLADRSRRDDTPEPESGPGQARQGIAAALGGAAGDVRRGSGAGVSTPDGKSQNEALASFFANLMKRGGGSGVNSPRTPQQGQE